MNRSLRVLRPMAARPLASGGLISRSAFLTSKSPFLAASAAGPSKLPVLFAPRVLGVRLYVAPTSVVAKDAPTEPKERGIIGNAVAEAKDVVGDLASIISGGQAPQPKAFSGTEGAVTPGNIAGGVMAAMETSSHSHSGNVKDDFVSVTSGLLQTVPRHVLLFGLAGTLPYLGTAAGTVFLAREANMTGNGERSLLGLDYDTVLTSLHSLEAAQITYGAVILSFLGALHWGMEFVGFGGEQGYRRLMVGTLPLLFAFPTVFLSHGTALASQWVGFTLTWFMDQRAASNGWTPPWFATYRFYLSIIVGFSIIGTLAGTSFYQEGAGHDFAGGKGSGGPDSLSASTSLTGFKSSFKNNTEKEKARRESGDAKGGGPSGPLRGTVGGDIYIEEDEALEAYGRLKNRTKAAEEDEEEEEESAGDAEEEGEKEDGAEDKEEKSEDKEESKDEDNQDASKGQPSEEDEGGSAGKSQSKKDDPNDKGAAGAENTGLR